MKKHFLLLLAAIALFASVSFTQSDTRLTKDSNFLEIFLAFNDAWLIAPYNFMNFQDLKRVTLEDKYAILDNAGTVVDYQNYSMFTQYPCYRWQGVTLAEIKNHGKAYGVPPNTDNCINTVELTAWKSNAGSLFVGIALQAGENHEEIPPLEMYEYKYKTNKWDWVNAFPTGLKQLPGLLQKKYPNLVKKRHSFRYILPAKGNLIRVAVTWSDTGDYKMPQLLDLAYIKLSNGKWVFVPL